VSEQCEQCVSECEFRKLQKQWMDEYDRDLIRILSLIVEASRYAVPEGSRKTETDVTPFCKGTNGA